MLSTLARAKDAAGLSAGVDAPTDAKVRTMMEGITPVFEAFLCRNLFVESRTLDLDVNAGQTQFNLRAFPVRSVSSVSFDATCFHVDTDLIADIDYIWDRDGVRLAYAPSPGATARRALRVVYTGGLVYGAAVGKLGVTAVTGTPTGAFSGPTASGTVSAFASNVLSYTLESGVVGRGDTLAGSGWTAVVSSTVEESVVNDYPGLEEAALMQFVFRWQRKLSLGRTSTPLGNGGANFESDYKLHPAVKEYLLHLRRTATDG